MFRARPHRLRPSSRPVALLLFVLLGTAAGTLTPADARAQDRGVNIDRFRPAFDAEGFLGVQGTRTPGAMRFNTSLWGSWATNPLTITPPHAW